MPGIHTIIDASIETRPEKTEKIKEALPEDYFKIESLIQTPLIFSSISYYDGYPFLSWANDTATVVLEGMIYNRPPEETKQEINKIARYFAEDKNYQSLVRDFVESSDGDYIVQIWDKATNTFLFFNDYFGRMTLYYSCRDKTCILSR